MEYLVENNTAYVGGTSGSDTFAGSDGSVIVNLNGRELFHLEGIDHLVFYGGAGDDNILIDEQLTVSTELYGGAGNDVIRGGGGSTTIDAGDGDDEIHGGTGTNTLITSSGTNTFYGGPGVNTIVASGDTGGTTAYVSGGGTVIVQADETVTTPQFAPTLGAIDGPATPTATHVEVAASAAYADLDLSLNAGEALTARWTWGDGTASEGIVSDKVCGTHSYAEAGVYTVSLTLTDSTSNSVTQSFEYAVVYDPSAGFVTGGGWIDSPEGAYAGDPLLTGRATFGVVSQYKKGASTPTGQTQFQFSVGNLNFHSTSYDWLVVGAGKAKYKGVGTINGQGSYNFIVTVVDGKDGRPDEFRIKMWDEITPPREPDECLAAAGVRALYSGG